MHRIFLAVNLPENIKKKLTEEQERITRLFPEECPIKWTRKENLHITVEFLGMVSDQEILDVTETVKRTVLHHQSFLLSLNQTLYGPPKASPPRMVWVTGLKSKELSDLRNDIVEGLSEMPLERDERPFSPHVTLGRILSWKFKDLELEEIPDVKNEVKLEFSAESVELMESELKKGGPQYTVLESFVLS